MKVKGLSQTAITGLLNIANAIIANPKGYDQHHYYDERDNTGCFAYYHSVLTASSRTLAKRLKLTKKWYSEFSAGERNPFYIAAKRELNLTEEQADRVFGDTYFWPYEFKIAYVEAKTDKGRARVGYKRILFFIKTNGTDEPQPTT